jgi:hypothetical protein
MTRDLKRMMQGIFVFSKGNYSLCCLFLKLACISLFGLHFLDKGSFYLNQDNYIELFDLPRFC